MANLVISLVLRFLHIWFAIAWIGAIIYGIGVMRRALPRLEPSARKELMKKLIPVVTQFIPGSAVMTIVFGVLLYLYKGNFDVGYLTGSDWGRILLASLVLALVAFGIGMIFGVRNAKKLLGHLNEESCAHGPEVGSLQKTFNASQTIVFVLGMVIVGLMVVATAGV